MVGFENGWCRGGFSSALSQAVTATWRCRPLKGGEIHTAFARQERSGLTFFLPTGALHFGPFGAP